MAVLPPAACWQGHLSGGLCGLPTGGTCSAVQVLALREVSVRRPLPLRPPSDAGTCRAACHAASVPLLALWDVSLWASLPIQVTCAPFGAPDLAQILPLQLLGQQ